MSEELTIKTEALQPLYAAWEEPNRHRVRAESGEGAVVIKGRRPSNIAIAQNLRVMVKEWRDTFYFGASDTSRQLLDHWFNRTHSVDGNEFRFSGGRELLASVGQINDFRNTRVAHQGQALTDRDEAKNALVSWISGLSQLCHAAGLVRMPVKMN